MRRFRIEACLDGVPGEAHVLLGDAQPLAGSDAQLQLDEIEARDHLGDGMLDLQARVHLQEVERPLGREQELHRAEVRVADGAGGSDGGGAHARAQVRVDRRRRCLLEHLLMPPLHRAIALAQMDASPVRVGEHLDLDVAGADHALLEDQLTGTEGARRFRPRRGECGGQLFLGRHETHAASAASGRGLDHYRKADALGLTRQRGVGLIAALVARHTWHAGLQHAPLGGRLVAHGGDGVGRWADEDEPCLGAGTRKVGILRQKAVARMDGVGAEALGGGDDRGGVQVARARFRWPDAGGNVGGAHVQGVGVDIGIDRGRAEAHGFRRAHDPARDLAAVGNEDGAERCHAGACLPSEKAEGPRYPSGRKRQSKLHAGSR
jgi:hypothetical protein